MGITWRLAILLIFLCAFAARALKPAEDQVKAGVDWPVLRFNLKTMHVAMASVKSSGNNDVDFVKLMLPHHQAAIDMARTQLMYGRDPQISRLAQEIITDQQSEIELMRLWLKQHEPRK